MQRLEQSRKIAEIAYKALDSKKAKDLKLLDIHHLSTLTDYFVIASGNNIPHLLALADIVEEQIGKEGIPISHREGYNSARWILLDFNGVVIHIFLEEDRDFYNLERLWTDAKELFVTQ